ncbi:hypothetical protein CMV_026489 [Castanea mollissima]|uniref:Uncharacterized protein n=1 Tax=Castanea mollissima TaxID=60419 RepID=A0A8J4V3S4_9ROSI|nr:hypothetical protein CMV_026489 [Castanea mollissima]
MPPPRLTSMILQMNVVAAYQVNKVVILQSTGIENIGCTSWYGTKLTTLLHTLLLPFHLLPNKAKTTNQPKPDLYNVIAVAMADRQCLSKCTILNFQHGTP